MKTEIKFIEKKLQENDMPFYRKLKNNMTNRGDGETIQAYLEDALAIFKKYDSGSLAFTTAKMQNIGHDYPFSILESIEEGLREQSRITGYPKTIFPQKRN